jgi:hypothetical protein
MKKITFFCFISLLLISSCKNNTEITEVTQIALSKSTAMLSVGDSLTLELSCTPANLPVPSCIWVSSDSTVARVDKNGKIKALRRGKSTIMAVKNENKILFAQCDITVTYKGDGSTSNPYLIYTVADLNAIRDSVNTKNAVYGNKAYKLMNDLDFSKETSDWTPIADTTTVAFKGVFDGNGKTIKGMNINFSYVKHDRNPYLKYGGLFGNIEGAEIKNLGVNWTVLFQTPYSGDLYLGGIAGYGSGTITNCNSTGFIKGYAQGFAYVGGILGNGTATITNCYSTGDISASSWGSSGACGYAGGILGKGTTTITNCHHDSGTLGNEVYRSMPEYAGGIAGHITGTISNCYSTGAIGYSMKCGGGIAGYSIGTIINCYSTGGVDFDSFFEITNGGIAGQSEGTIINCYSASKISGTFAGGIAGSGTDITNCYATGSITGSKYVCGIAAVATNVSYCIALNSNIWGWNVSESIVTRACGLFSASGTANNNYASPSIVVKKNYSSNVTVKDFSDTKLHGLDLTAQPADLLNDYVTSNPTFNNIGLKKWKVTAGVNNGYPVFE